MIKNWTPDLAPAMMSDDIAFVGGAPVSSHLLISGDGLILLDSGYPGMLEGIAANIRALGFNIADVRHVLHSHAHIDHYGNTAELARLTGAKTYIGLEDAGIARGALPLSWAKELGLAEPEPFEPDVLFHDGDALVIGGRAIRCVHAPGHTAGTYAFFIDTSLGPEPLVAAMHGGVGTNSMERSFLQKYGLPLSCREEFRAGLKKLRSERVDIVLGNHPDQCGMAEKLEKTGARRFCDSIEWARFLDACEARLDKMLSQEENV